jgi:hypothetical protein
MNNVQQGAKAVDEQLAAAAAASAELQQEHMDVQCALERLNATASS